MFKLKIWDKELGISDYGGKAVVSSRTLAKIFDKRHDNGFIKINGNGNKHGRSSREEHSVRVPSVQF